ncbi:MAG: glycosyltransferase family 39 protein [Candidatus Woesebacteria bacterium]
MYNFLKSHRPLLTLLFVFFIALVVRLYALGQMPLHLHQDEIMNGYVGRYILQNGKDLYGNKWPLLYFDNFGDFPSVIPMYLSGLFTYVFGMTEFAIRFPIAVFGALTVFPLYFIIKKLTYSHTTALAGAVFLAFSPWHIVLSRATAEAIPGSMLFLCGVAFLLQAFETKKNWRYYSASFLFFLSTYLFYHPFRIIVPLFLLGAFVLFWRKASTKILAFMMVFFFLLTFGISRTPWGLGRFKQTSVFTFNSTTNNRIDMYARDAGQNHILDLKIFNNKPLVYGREIIRQYFSYLSPDFLFTDGGRPYRYLVPDQGLVQISLLAIAVFVVGFALIDPSQFLKQRWDNSKVYLISWLVLISPLTAALTLDEVPNVHRSAVFGVTLIFLFAFIYFRFQAFKTFSKPLLIAFWIAFSLETVYFFHQYIVLAPAAEARSRYDERTELVKKIIEDKGKYSDVIVTREVFSIYYLFYTHNLDANLAGKFKTNLVIPEVDNLHFIDNDCPTQEKTLPLGPNSLIIDMQHCIVSDKYETTNAFPDNSLYRTYLYSPKQK